MGGGNDIYPGGADPGHMSGELWTSVQQLVMKVAAVLLWSRLARRPDRSVTPLSSGMSGRTLKRKKSTRRRRRCSSGRLEARCSGNRRRGGLPVPRPANGSMAGGLTSGAPFPVTHLSVGRCVLERRRRGRNVSAYTLSRAALAHFNVDGVHLSPPDIRRSQPSRAGQGGCSCRGLCLLCAVLPLVGLHTCTMYIHLRGFCHILN